MAWGIGGWLLTPFLGNALAETIGWLRARVAAELTTTFVSTYTREASLAGMGDRGEIPRHSAGASVNDGGRQSPVRVNVWV
jgi:hypothetical protein